MDFFSFVAVGVLIVIAVVVIVCLFVCLFVCLLLFIFVDRHGGLVVKASAS